MTKARWLLLALIVSAQALAAPPKPPDEVTWTKHTFIKGVLGSYCPWVITGPNLIRVYTNTNGTTEGNWFMSSGSITSVGNPILVLPTSQITDQVPAYIRTTAVVRGPSGKYYGLLHIGDAYPSNVGFSPAWAESDDGVVWTYYGKFQIDGSYPPLYSSSAALVVQEEKPYGVWDNANPANHRFLVWEDTYNPGNSPRKLVLVYSADGRTWRFYRDAANQVVDVWPNETWVQEDTPVFPTATRYPHPSGGHRYHLIAANRWPADYHRHLLSCDGVKWRVLEVKAETRATTGKGTNLVYDDSARRVRANTVGNHLSFSVDAYNSLRCP